MPQREVPQVTATEAAIRLAYPSSQNPELPPTGMQILHSPADLNEKFDYSSIARETSRYSSQKCLLINGASAAQAASHYDRRIPLAPLPYCKCSR